MEGPFSVVRAYLLADSTIAAFVGTRIYPIKAPQGATYPLVTMQKIVEPRPQHLRGPGGLSSPRYQIDAWSRDVAGAGYMQAQDLGAAIRSRIDGFTGVLTDSNESPAERHKVSILYDDSRDLFETDVNYGYYRHSADYVIWHQPVTT